MKLTLIAAGLLAALPLAVQAQPDSPAKPASAPTSATAAPAYGGGGGGGGSASDDGYGATTTGAGSPDGVGGGAGGGAPAGVMSYDAMSGRFYPVEPGPDGAYRVGLDGAGGGYGRGDGKRGGGGRGRDRDRDGWNDDWGGPEVCDRPDGRPITYNNGDGWQTIICGRDGFYWVIGRNPQDGSLLIERRGRIWSGNMGKDGRFKGQQDRSSQYHGGSIW